MLVQVTTDTKISNINQTSQKSHKHSFLDFDFKLEVKRQ